MNTQTVLEMKSIEITFLTFSLSLGEIIPFLHFLFLPIGIKFETFYSLGT